MKPSPLDDNWQILISQPDYFLEAKAWEFFLRRGKGEFRKQLHTLPPMEP